MNYSVTIIGIVVSLVGLLFQKSGLDVGPDRIQTTIEVLMQFGGLIAAWYGRYRAGGITIAGARK